jgi:membrane-bound serine protease (ClpP class)
VRTLAKRVASRAAALGLLAAALGLLLGTGSASAQDDYCVEHGCVRILQVAGLIDPIVAEFIRDGLDEANGTPGYVGVILEIDSDGTVLDTPDLVDLAKDLASSRVPVTAWINTGAVARGGAAEMVSILPGSTMVPGARIGDIGEQRLPSKEFGDLLEGDRGVLRSSTIEVERAAELGVVEGQTLTAVEHLTSLDGVEVEEVTDDDGDTTIQPVSRAVLSKLGLWSQLLHTAASPALAYILLCVGVGLLIFEFFTAGIGIAGLVGAGAFVLSGYGLGVLPTRTWALVLLGIATVGFAIDVQAGVPRFWTAVGTIGWVVGSIWLFDGVSLPWVSLVVGAGGLLVGMVSGMPAMVRSRFGTPTIGRDWMIGAEGTAKTAVDPDGVVVVDGAQWRARTNRATPIAEGEAVRVVAIDGLTLEVEPPEGGAIDYRERRKSRQ